MTGRVRLLAAAIVVVLVGDAAGLVVVGRDDETGGVDVAGAAAMRLVVPEIEAFVERERGLQFKRPVNVELLDDKAFVKRLRGDGEQDVQALAEAEDFFRALHLIDGDVRLGAAVDSLLSSAVAGFYDPKRKALVVRGGEPTPSVRAVLAHELTHALQDQHFDLERPALDERTDEAPQGFTGLVEGDAVRIQVRYFESLSEAEREAFIAEESAVTRPEGIPDVLVNLLLFPYQAGPPFVNAVLAAGGQPRLDAAFAAPPETSEQLLHPEVYLRGEKAKPVPGPRADGTVFDRGVVGEFGLLLLLADALEEGAAKAAAAGWGGDRYVAWRSSGRACVRARFVMDTGIDRVELEAALRRWARRHHDVTVAGSGDSPITLTSCA
ncbi:MAG: hypothetical protein QOG87_359 [Actinomycetota bacterium]